MGKKPDLLLKYYREVTKSKDLHFGYWEKGEELDMKHLLLAQDRYADHLLSFVPAGVKTVLDVGCGVGGNAARLTQKGYDVTSLSPDPYQEGEFRKNTGGRVPFILSKFEDLRTDKKFDLIFMAESVQYIDTVRGFEKSRRLLKKGGHILACDYFREEGVKDGAIMFAGRYHRDYLAQAQRHGFKIVKSEDITDRVSPSFDFMASLYYTYIIPSFKIVAYAIEVYIPFFYKVVRLLLRKPFKKILEKSLIDSKTFARYRRYMIYLFQLQDEGVPPTDR